MRIGVFECGWWKAACEALGHETVSLPQPEHPSGNLHAADLPGRIAAGTSVVSILADKNVDFLLDNGAAGLGFVHGTGGGDDLALAHEVIGKPLVSHFIDPIVTVFQGLGWPTTWQCLQRRTWGKAVWDKAQAIELQQFGVPNVVHLPMAAPNRPYNVDPLDPAKCRPVVSFVGSQNTRYFAANSSVPTGNLLPGVLAQAIRADLHNATFYDIYHNVYGLGEPIQPNDTMETQVQKTLSYFNVKLFDSAALCIRNRDRFVIFLKRHLGDAFQLIGQHWDTTYGLKTEQPLATTEAYFNHFREVAINLNLVNGNAETGLNMRHFEITAAGGFMLCYDQPELEELFEVGKECVVFHSEQDLLEKVKYYLNHPEERVAIAQAGQRRTLSQHLYSHRLQTLLKIVQITSLPVEYSSTTWSDDLRSLVPEADVVLDCGANVGQMAESLRNIYPKARIFSFEPVSSVFEQLREKCKTINVHPVKKAVGDYDGPAKINLTASREANSLLDFQEGNPCAQWTEVVGQEDVEVCTIDRWCQENDIDPARVDAIKLDVQGAELKALTGARKVLETAKAVYTEVSFVPMYKDSPLLADIDAFMTKQGYRRHAVYPSDQPHHRGDALYLKV